MQVKFGFYLSVITKGLGLSDPEKQFYEATIHEWFEVEDGKFIDGNPVGRQVKLGEPVALIETLKATEEWTIDGLLPGSAGGKIISINRTEDKKWRFHKPKGELLYEKTPYGWLLRPELGIIEVDDAEIASLPPFPDFEEIATTTDIREETPAAPPVPETVREEPRGPQEQPEQPKELDARVQPSKRISIPAQRLAKEENLTFEQLIAANPDRTWIGKEQVAELAERRNSIIPAAPAARALARRFGLDLSAVPSKGPQSVVTREDVMRQLTPEGVLLLPIALERRTIAHNLEEGISGTVVAGGAIRYNLRRLQALRARLGAYKADRGEDVFLKAFGVPFQISMLVAYAMTRVLSRDITALLESPEHFKGHALFNGYWHIDETEKDLPPHERRSEKVAIRTYVHFGISSDTGVWPKLLPGGELGGPGLRILTFRDAHTYTDIKDFFASLGDLTRRAAEDAARGDGVSRATKGSEWSGASIIFNNIGAIGHEEGFSLVPGAMSAMLNIGVMDDTGHAVFQIFFDHRMIDGRTTTRFLNAVHEELVESVIPQIIQACFPG